MPQVLPSATTVVPTLDESLQKTLSIRRERGALRSLCSYGVFEGADKAVDFFSNDYLGFARSRSLHQSIMSGCATLPSPYNGATGSRLLSGNLAGIAQIERRLASFFETPATLLFSSGYHANLAVFSALPKRGDTVWYDAHIHASVKDGVRLGHAKHHAFRHNDANHLEEKLRKGKKRNQRQYVAVEAVYSMYGDECPLADMCAVCERYQAHLILDEAHSTGIYGKNGNGMGPAHSKQAASLIRIHTFGKAMGVQGAVVASSQAVKEYLVNYARPFIYTTAPSPYLTTSIQCAVEHLSTHAHLIAQLRDNISFFGAQAKRLPASMLSCSHTPIQSLVPPTPAACKAVSEVLMQKNLCVLPILPPTAKKGKEHLRVCLHAFNTKEEIKILIRTFAQTQGRPAP